MHVIFTLFGIIILVFFWTLGSYFMGSFIIPWPWTSLQDTLLLLGKSHTWHQLGISLTRVIVGFSLAFISGTVVGVFMGRRRAFEVMCKPIVLLIQGIPPILWAIPLILILGSSHLSPVFVIALICFPLVTMNVAEGMKSVPQKLEEMLKVFAPGMFPKIKEIILPHLKPFFAASLKLGFVLGIKASVVGEYFGATDGIGFQIQAAYQSLQVRKLFSWGMLLVLLIILFDYLLSRIEKRSSIRKTSENRRGMLSCEREDIEELKNVFSAKRVSPAILLENVSFKYDGSKNILEGINLIVNPEEIVVISGDSGIGKTTLLNIIASLLKSASGKVVSPQNLGFIFQDDRFLPWRNIVRNTALPLIYQGYNKRSSLYFANYLLNEVGLAGKELKYPEELSGGMKKRLAFARCFARLPGSILMDEPFTGLHKEARSLLWEKFFDLLNLHPVPVIIVTHFPEEVPVSSSCSFYTLSGNPAKLIKR